MHIACPGPSVERRGVSRLRCVLSRAVPRGMLAIAHAIPFCLKLRAVASYLLAFHILWLCNHSATVANRPITTRANCVSYCIYWSYAPIDVGMAVAFLLTGRLVVSAKDSRHAADR